MQSVHIGWRCGTMSKTTADRAHERTVCDRFHTFARISGGRTFFLWQQSLRPRHGEKQTSLLGTRNRQLGTAQTKYKRKKLNFIALHCTQCHQFLQQRCAFAHIMINVSLLMKLLRMHLSLSPVSKETRRCTNMPLVRSTPQRAEHLRRLFQVRR